MIGCLLDTMPFLTFVPFFQDGIIMMMLLVVFYNKQKSTTKKSRWDLFFLVQCKHSAFSFVFSLYV